MAIISLSPRNLQELPALLKGTANGEHNEIAASTNPIYICELFAVVAAVFQTRELPIGKKASFFVDNEAACAALTTGAAKNPVALLLGYALWAVAAQRDVGLWAERVPTEVNPADPPARDRELSFETETVKGLASLRDILSS